MSGFLICRIYRTKMCKFVELICSIMYSLCCCQCLRDQRKSKRSSSKRRRKQRLKKTAEKSTDRQDRRERSKDSKDLKKSGKYKPINEITDDEFREKYLEKIPKDMEPEEYLRTIKNYEILKESLGEGGYGAVYKAIKYSADKKEMIAVKVITVDRRRNRKKMTAVKREMQSFKIFKMFPSWKHNHIVHVYDTFFIETNDKVRIESLTQAYIFMELAEGNLDDELRHTGPMDDQIAKRYFSQIVYALDYLHRLGIAHRDIKLANLLVFKSDEPNDRMTGKTVKLTDFGLSDLYFIEERGYILTEKTGGSLYYKSPEILKNEISILKQKIKHFKVDIWALGVCLFRLLTDSYPFSGFPDLKRVIELQENKAYAYPKSISINLKAKDLIGRLLEPNPDIRPYIYNGVKNHQWLQGEISLSVTTASSPSAN